MVRSETTTLKTGHISRETRYYISSQQPEERSPAQWQHLIRGHWAGVESRNHWRRDALWGEDDSRTRNPTALANLALLRSVLLVRLAEAHPDQPLPQLFERFGENRDAAIDLINDL